MRIGYLVQQFPPEVGAGPARIGEFALLWQESGSEVIVFTGFPNRPAGIIPKEYRGRWRVSEHWHGVRVWRSWLYASPKHGFARTLFNNLTFMLTGAITAASRLRSADLLVASSPPFFVHVAGWLVARRQGIPLVLEVRDLWPDYLEGMGKLRNRLVRWTIFTLEAFLLRSADQIVVVTESFRNRIVEKGVPPERVSVIPNGVDLAKYYRDAAMLPPIRDWPSAGFVVGYLGNFGVSQRLETVVEAAALLSTEAPDVAVVLVGDGTQRREVERAVAAVGSGNITIHAPIAKDHTPAFYNSCDVCVVPLAQISQLQDTIPSKLFEVMACERPVIGSLAGEAADLITKSECGLVCAPGDPRALADAIKVLAEMPQPGREEMGRRGRAAVAMSHERSALAEQYLSVLRATAEASASVQPIEPRQ